jgi:hypothetical protein
MGNQPGQFPDFLIGGQGQDKPGAADRLQFDDFGDFDLAHGPMHPAAPVFVSVCFLAAKDADFRGLAQWIISLATALVGHVKARSDRCQI